MENLKESPGGFTLLEVMVAVGVFSLVTISAAGIFVSIHNSWHVQTIEMDLVKDAHWAMEFIRNEIRQAGQIITPPPDGNLIRFNIDPDFDGTPPYRTIEYQRQGTTLQRRWMEPGLGWQPWEELANFIHDNPAGLGDIFSLNAAGNSVTITITTSIKNRTHTLRSQARLRNL